MRFFLIPVVVGLGLGVAATPVRALDMQILGAVTLGFNLTGDAGKRSDFNPKLEADFGGIYAGAGAHIYNDSTNTEIAPYFGYRNVTAGGLSYDVSYTRSILPNDGGDCCGTIGVDLALPIGNRVTGKLDMGLVPETGASEINLGVDVAAFDLVTLSASAGMAGDDPEWEVSAGYELAPSTMVTATYHDGRAIKPQIGLDLTWNFSVVGN